VQVALHIPGAYNLTIHLPIIIGTVPYRGGALTYPDSRFYHEAQAHFQPGRYLDVPAPPPYRETITPPPPFEGKPWCDIRWVFFKKGLKNVQMMPLRSKEATPEVLLFKKCKIGKSLKNLNVKIFNA